ncbi:MAG: ribonuclease E/G [Lachnospiraceae bacterium]|nr:ribonuclease E/G [Lachnospiraceae bacterium]
MNDDKILITEYEGHTLVSVKEDGMFRSLSLIPDDDKIIGSIINARVDKKADNIEAVFVCLDGREMGYLEGTGLKPGDLLPVMIEKSSLKEKRAVVTKNLSLKGLTCIVSDGKGRVRCSKKLPLKTKERLEKLLKPLAEERPYDVIIRTNARYTTDDIVLEEYKMLCGRLERIHDIAAKRTAYSVLYRQYGAVSEKILSLNLSRCYDIITDIKEIYDTVKEEILEGLPEGLKDRLSLKLYEDDQVKLFTSYGLKTCLFEALGKKVWLRSGGYLIIEETEALNVIDVNTGKTSGNGSKEETIKKINTEAVVEAARQIRLRNLSGIIIMDLINMKREEDLNELIGLLKDEIKKDPVQTSFHDVTKLSLIELTRKREYVSLKESMGNIKI